MSEQTGLLVQLNLLRDLLDSPTTLPLKDQRLVRKVAQRLGDGCWCNAGWHASKTRGKLTGEASTATLLAEMANLIELLQSHAKPKRGKGRPLTNKISFVDGLIALPELAANRHGSQASTINDLVKRGLLDKKKTTEALLKRLGRLAKRPPPHRTNNVLIFSPKKKPRR